MEDRSASTPRWNDRVEGATTEHPASWTWWAVGREGGRGWRLAGRYAHGRSSSTAEIGEGWVVLCVQHLVWFEK